MPFDLSMSPTTLLAMWAGGIAAATSFVAWWRVVGAGYLWTAGGAVLIAGAAAATAGPLAAVGTAGAVAAILMARRGSVAAVAFGVAGLGFLGHAIAQSPSDGLLAVSGALALGGTSAEMLLGHWYLVDPRLPRWALRRLDASGIAGLVLDAGVVIAMGGLAGAGAGAVGWAFVVLALVSVLMMLGVWFSLKETGYEGVMAATGLSYLSVLTALGTVALGRFLVA